MISNNIRSLRTFVGAKDYGLSRRFYKEWGFVESEIDKNMSYFYSKGLGFYLQDYYVRDWVDNTMMFMEVANVDMFWQEISTSDLLSRYPIRLTPPKTFEWGKECFLHDPSGVLWHIGEFKKR